MNVIDGIDDLIDELVFSLWDRLKTRLCRGLANLRDMLKLIGVYDWLDALVAIGAASIGAFLIWAWFTVMIGAAALGPR